MDETAVVTFVHENGVITNLIESWNTRSAPRSPLLAIYGTEGSSPRVECHHARADIELVSASYESARTGQVIGLPLEG